MAKTRKDKITVARLWSRYNGGVPTRAPIILGFDKDKFRTICIYLKKSSDAENYFQQQGLDCYYISRQKFFRIFNVAAICRLVKIFKQEKVDILHCHRHQASTYGMIAAKLAGVKVVFAHVHGLNRSKAPRRRFINSLLLRKATRIFTVGEAVKKDVLAMNRSLKPEAIISIGNSIDSKRFIDIQMTKHEAKKRLGLDPDSIVFGTVGRFAPTKGYSYLIDAFVSAKKQVPHAKLVFVGDGRCEDEIKAQVKKYGIENSVCFLGRRKDVPEILRAFDVFLMPSIAEGIPRALLEAMAAGVPCIGTNVGGIPEVLDGGKFGFLTPSKDPDALAKCMLEALHLSEQQLNEIIEKSRQRIINKYSHSVVRKRLENVYKENFFV